MAQYSNSVTQQNGFVINAVLNTETNRITYTVTSPQGLTATASTSATAPVPTANLVSGLLAKGQTGGISIGGSLGEVRRDVTSQADRAETAATATNTPAPSNPSPPAPVSNTTNPAVPPPTPEPSTVTPTNTSPAPVTEPTGTQAPADPTPINGLDLPPTPAINGLDLPDPPDTPINGLDLPPEPEEFGNLDQAIERVQSSEPVLSEDGEVATGIRRNTETGEIFYTDPPRGNEPEFDEFGNLDQAIERVQSSEAVLSEDGTEATGIRRNTETGEIFYTDPPKGDEPAFDEFGNLDEAIAAQVQQNAATSGNTNRGIPGATKNARAQATLQDTTNFQQKKDWRVRLSLSPGANYLYKDSSNTLLAPLRKTDGIIFPYTPTINVTYGANYQPTAPTHSNYKIFQYENSYVDNVTITCEFTAQDTAEANYLLAVIHFLRSVTKMFYGQDQNPKPGTPPPLCYLFGLGEFQFNAQPLAISNFTYNLPNDVDYIRAGALTLPPGVSRAEQGDNSKSNTSKGGFFEKAASALAQGAISKLGGTAKSVLGQLMPGGKIAGPNFSSGFNANIPPGTKEPTYVPTKISITIQALPIVSRYEVSNNFSVRDYANGKLLNGVKRAGGGFW